MLKERASGMYRLSAFYFARTASDLPMDCTIPTIFIIIIYFMSDLKYARPPVCSISRLRLQGYCSRCHRRQKGSARERGETVRKMCRISGIRAPGNTS